MLNGFTFASAGTVLSLDRWTRLQDHAQWTCEDPWMVVFVSHRWEAPDNPDPNGQQLRALQTLLTNTAKILRALCSPPDQRATLVSSLSKHGWLQAATLAFRFATNQGSAKATNEELPNAFFHGCVVWYDYACLPQRPRTLEEDEVFYKTLSKLQALIASPVVTTIALREDGDDFDERAWCVAEVATALSPAFHAVWEETFPLVLRIDCIDQPFELDQLAPTLVTALQSWEEPPDDTPAHQILLDIIEACSQDQLRQPRYNRTEQTPFFHITFQASGKSQSLVLSIYAHLKGLAGQEIDLAELIINSTRANQLYCTNNGDVVFAGLLIMDCMRWSEAERVRLLDQPASWSDPDLWTMAVMRWSKRQPLRIVVSDSCNSLSIWEIGRFGFRFAE